jgi:hypothetical protein
MLLILVVAFELLVLRALVVEPIMGTGGGIGGCGGVFLLAVASAVLEEGFFGGRFIELVGVGAAGTGVVAAAAAALLGLLLIVLVAAALGLILP